MIQDKKQCETCAWPLECSDDMKAQKPEGADCPREIALWERRLADAKLALPAGTELDMLGEAEPVDKELVLV